MSQDLRNGMEQGGMGALRSGHLSGPGWCSQLHIREDRESPETVGSSGQKN